jgi:hypothetical protein
MADQRTSVFQPITQEQLQGPFSEALQPTRSQQEMGSQGPPVLAGKGTSLGYLASKFIRGATEGRIKAFQQQENSKVRNLNVLQQYVKTVYEDPNMTEEAKQYALQQYSRALGATTLDAAGGAGGGKGGKGGKKGQQPSGGGGGEAKPGDIKGHITNIVKDLATGMTGGKMPKGGNINPQEIIGNIYAEISQPKYQKQGIVENNVGNIQNALKALPPGTSQEEAMKAAFPHLQQIERQDPKRADSLRQDIASQYQPAPKVGSEQYYLDRAMKSLGDSAAGGGLQGPPGPPAPPPLTASSLADFKLAKKVEEKQITGLTPDGKKIGPTVGYQVTIPGRGISWYAPDDQGNPVLVNGVREVGLAQQAEVKLGPVIAAPAGMKDAYGKPIPEGSGVKYGTMGDLTGYFRTVHKDLAKGNDIMGSSAPPGSTDVWGRPLTPGQLYTTYRDEQGAPKTYVPKAMETEYKAGVDDEGKPYAIPVPRYQGGGGGASPGTAEEPKDKKGGKEKPKTEGGEKKPAVENKAEKILGAPNPFRKTAAPQAATSTPKPEEKPKSAMPKGAISLGAAKQGKPKEMSQMGKRVLAQTDTTLEMAKKLKTFLEQKDPKTGKPFKDENTGFDKLSREASWLRYNAGFSASVKDALGQIQPFIALESIVGAQSYMSGRFNMKYFDAVSKHIPQTTDTPSLMYEKVTNILRQLPEMRTHLMEVEGGKFINGVWTPGKSEQAPKLSPENPFNQDR